MSDHKMVPVPTKDGMVEVPAGTIISDEKGYIWFAQEKGFSLAPDDWTTPHGDRTWTIVAIPDGEGGWTSPHYRDKVSEWVSLTPDQVGHPDDIDHTDTWTPLRGGPTEDHVGARLRCAVSGSINREGVLAGIEHGLAYTILGPVEGDWYIHPDDLPSTDDDSLDVISAYLGKKEQA